MPAQALRCRSCAAEYPLEDIGTCTECFAPLDPVYDWDELARTVTRETIQPGRRPSRPSATPRRSPGRGTAGPGYATERRRASPGTGVGFWLNRHPTHSFGRRRRRSRDGQGARPRDHRLLLDRKPRQRGRRAGRGRGDRGGRLLPGRSRAREARRHRRLRCHHLCRPWNLRRLQPPHDRALVRASLGVRQREPALVLRRGIEDRRVRDRRAARLGRA